LSKRGEDDRYICNFGPRQHRDLISEPERLNQQEETKAEGQDARPDHRERAKSENEYHRGHCVLGKLAFDYEHTLPFPGLFVGKILDQWWLHGS